MTKAGPPRLSWAEIAAWLGPGDRLIMVASSVAALAVGALRFSWPEAVLGALLSGVAVGIALIDLRHFRIPDRLSLPLIPLGLLFAALSGAVLVRVLVMAAVWVVLTLFQKAFLRWRGVVGLGGGDIKLMTAAAAWLDPPTLPWFVLAASLTALIEALIRRANHQGRIAFGAHLAPWLALFVLTR